MTSSVSREPADRSPHFPRAHAGHQVTFYDRDRYPHAQIATYLAHALKEGSAAIVIATAAHTADICASLANADVDVVRCRSDGRLVMLDAEAALSHLVVDGEVVPGAFVVEIGARVHDLVARFGSLRAFGEMVDVLCARRQLPAALTLERMWNELEDRAPFELMCVYDLGAFEQASSHADFTHVCNEHAEVGVIDAEQREGDDRPRLVAHLVQRRRALSAEADRRAHVDAERHRRASADAFLAQASALLSSSLDYQETVERVAQLAVPKFADWCIVDLLTEDGASYDRVAVGHHREGSAATAEALKRRYSLDATAAQGVARSIADRRSQLLRSVEDAFFLSIARDDAHLRAARALGARSFVIAPLVARGRACGALTLAACDADFDEHDVWLAERLAASAAAAIDNARLFAREQLARLRISRMQEVTAALSRARTATEVAEAACRIGASAMEAVSGALWLLRDDGALTLAGQWGTPDEYMSEFRVIAPGTSGVPALEVVRTEQPMWIETEEDAARSGPAIFAKAKAAGRVASYSAVPLTLDGRVAGVVVFAHPIGHHYDDDERAFYVALAQHCSQALDRARLLDAERRSNERLRLLAAAGQTLASSLDLDTTLVSLARVAVPAFADWCSIDVVEHDQIRRVATVHADAEKALHAERIAREHPARIGDGKGIARVIADAKPRFFPRLPVDVMERGARSDDALAFLREAPPLSTIVLPLHSDDACVGAISFATAESGRVYDENDFAFAQQLGHRAALALSNARLYREAQDAARRAEEANRIKDEFLATVSHELRTPLNAITGWVSLLSRKAHDGASVTKGLEVIRRNAQAQAKIVEDILDVSRIITGKLKIDPRPVDVIAIVRDAMDVVRPSAASRGIALSLETPSDTACLLVGDGARLQQVVWNLLSNAIKFTSEGGVTVRVEQNGPSIAVTVTDTGCGIDPAFLPHVFERFRQADSSTTRAIGGLGLGLAIVRHIVELHGGRVSAESAGKGAGTTFSVVLPVRAIATQPLDEEAAASERLRSMTPTEGGLNGVRALVVDDEPDARELIEIVLAEAGAVVCTADCARTALDALDTFRPDVIVSDIGMPGEDGYAFIRRVRKRAPSACGNVAAVALTAYARSEDRVRALNAGFSSHVAKPVEPNELVAVIAGLYAVRAR